MKHDEALQWIWRVLAQMQVGARTRASEIMVPVDVLAAVVYAPCPVDATPIAARPAASKSTEEAKNAAMDAAKAEAYRIERKKNPPCPDCDCRPCACLIDREEPGEFAGVKPGTGSTDGGKA